MRHKPALFVAIAAATVGLLPASVAAQARLPSYEAATIVRSLGLDPLGPPERRGAHYVVRAVDDFGEEVRVTVDARDRRVISIRPVPPAAVPDGGRHRSPAYPPERYGYDPRDEWGPDGYLMPPPGEPRVIYGRRDYGGTPRPPGSVPGAKPPGQSKTAAKPLPKPAPKDVAAAPEVNPPSELTAGSIGEAAKQPEQAPMAPAMPPVQGLE